MMQEGGLDCVTGLGKHRGRLIILLDISKVLAAREAGNEGAPEIPFMAKNAMSGAPSTGPTARSTTPTKGASAGK